MGPYLDELARRAAGQATTAANAGEDGPLAHAFETFVANLWELCIRDLRDATQLSARPFLKDD